MANNNIQLLKSTDILATSVEIINSNFITLRDSIGSGNNGIASYAQTVDGKFGVYETKINEINEEMVTIQEKIKSLEDKMKSIEDKITMIENLLSESDPS